MKKEFIYKKIVTFILILSFVTPIIHLAVPRAHALEGDFIGGPSNIVAAGSAFVSAVSNVASAVADEAYVLKEFFLDGLQSLIKEVLIKSITRSIVNWINSGFEGEPAFVTDLDGFLLDVGDQVIGRYIEGRERLAGLCSPFSIDVRISLALDYYSSDKVSCTLTDVIGNVQDAFGDFSSGNAWDSWYELSINPSNNAYGAFIGARQAAREEVANTQDTESQKLTWGSGFKSFEVCDDPNVNPDEFADDEPGDVPQNNPAPNVSASASVNGTGVGINCRISTPGIVINEQLNNLLPSGLRQLELADEINEIIGALLGQLLQQVLGGSSEGLSGISSSRNGRPSYVDQLVQERNDSSSISGKFLEAIRTDLQREGEYRDAKQTSLNAVRVVQGNVESLYQCYLEKASQKRTLWGIVGEGNNKEAVSFTTAQLISSANSASSTITGALLPIKNKLTKDIEQSDTIIGQLVAIRTKVENTQSIEDLNTATNEYQILQQGGQLKNIKDVFDAELERDGFPGDQPGLARGIIRGMALVNDQTNASLNVCQSLVLTQKPTIIVN